MAKKEQPTVDHSKENTSETNNQNLDENKSTFSRLLDAILDLTKDVWDDGKKIIKKHKLAEKNSKIVDSVKSKTSKILKTLSESIEPKSSKKTSPKQTKVKEGEE